MAKFSDLINDETPVLIDFHATWCGPCKMLAPTIKDVKQELGDKLKILKIDIDKNQAIARKLGVQGVPTLMLYKDGKQLWRQSGVLSYQELMNNLNNHLTINAA